MVNTGSRKIIDKVTNAKGLDGYIETGQWDVIQIPLWLLKGMLSKDWDVPLTFNQFDNEEKESPLQIPSWLFKNLLREGRDVPLTVNQVASLLEVHPKTVQRWSRLGLIRRQSSSCRGSPRFLIADVVDALMNTSNMQRLFNRKGTGLSKTEANDMLDEIGTLKDQLQDFTSKLRDFMAGKTNRESVEKAVELVESSAKQLLALLTRLEKSNTN